MRASGLCSREVLDPIPLPGSPVIGGKRLLAVKRLRRDVREDEVDVDRLAMERLTIGELATAVLEVPYHRRSQKPVVARRKINAPLARLRVISAQAQSLDMARRAVEFEFEQIGAALPDLSDVCRALKLNPRVRSRQWVQQSLEANLPVSNFPVEIVFMTAA